MYIYVLVSLTEVYVFKEVASFRGARSINGSGAEEMHARDKQEERMLLSAYIETETNS